MLFFMNIYRFVRSFRVVFFGAFGLELTDPIYFQNNGDKQAAQS